MPLSHVCVMHVHTSAQRPVKVSEGARSEGGTDLYFSAPETGFPLLTLILGVSATVSGQKVSGTFLSLFPPAPRSVVTGAFYNIQIPCGCWGFELR